MHPVPDAAVLPARPPHTGPRPPADRCSVPGAGIPSARPRLGRTLAPPTASSSARGDCGNDARARAPLPPAPRDQPFARRRIEQLAGSVARSTPALRDQRFARRRRIAALRRLATLFALALLLVPWTPSRAQAFCSCASGGVPRVLSFGLAGNDLDRLKGECAPPRALVELQVQQQQFRPLSPQPPGSPLNNFLGNCINDCRWTSAGFTTARNTGWFEFTNLDDSFSVQVVGGQPRPQLGAHILTRLRLRTQDPRTARWSAWTEAPEVQAFYLAWNHKEEHPAHVDTRIHRADWMHVSVADGPDDGDEPTIALDVDQDTPNAWLRRQGGNGVVQYTWTGWCNWWDPGDCPAGWLTLLSPTITVDSPMLGAASEYPWVLGMASAGRPGAMVIATSAVGPRDLADIEVRVDVDVDVSIDIDFGFDFGFF